MTTEQPRLAKLERIWSPPIGGSVCGRRVPARQTLLIVGVDLARI